jgi:hypothetical protein
MLVFLAMESGHIDDIHKAEFMARASDHSFTKAKEAFIDWVISPHSDVAAKFALVGHLHAQRAERAYDQGVRDLSEIFPEDSPEVMGQNGWVSRGNYFDRDEYGGAEVEIVRLGEQIGYENVTSGAAYDIFRRTLENATAVYVRPEVWHPYQRRRAELFEKFNAGASTPEENEELFGPDYL